jgi:hypothetical protein
MFIARSGSSERVTSWKCSGLAPSRCLIFAWLLVWVPSSQQPRTKHNTAPYGVAELAELAGTATTEVERDVKGNIVLRNQWSTYGQVDILSLLDTKHRTLADVLSSIKM